MNGPPLPVPTKIERWVSDGGWLVDLLLPSTDRGVLVQALVISAAFCLLCRRMRRLGLLQLWVGAYVFVAGLFVLRAAH